jgi:hypothetical protein
MTPAHTQARCQIDSMQAARRRPLFINLGVLDRLPTKILLQVLESLSIQRHLVFRNCCQSARTFVGTIPTVRAILEFAPHTLRGILAIDTNCAHTGNSADTLPEPSPATL